MSIKSDPWAEMKKEVDLLLDNNDGDFNLYGAGPLVTDVRNLLAENEALRGRGDAIEQAYNELTDLYVSIYASRVEAAYGDDHKYWQGKKDGLRMALTLIGPTATDRRRWATLQTTSPSLDNLSEIELEILDAAQHD